MGLLLGLKREKAFTFSFLLSIPAIVGDFVVEAYTKRGLLSTSGLGAVEAVVGVVAAMVVGYVALRLLAEVVRGRKFHYFAFYTSALGIALLLATLLIH